MLLPVYILYPLRPGSPHCAVLRELRRRGCFLRCLSIRHLPHPDPSPPQLAMPLRDRRHRIFGIIAWFWLPADPGTAWFLSPPQRNFAVMRMQLDNARYVQHHRYSEDGLENVSERLSRRDVVETARDWKMWFALVCNICASVPGQAFSVFLPLVVKGLGYASVEANLVGSLFFRDRFQV